MGYISAIMADFSKQMASVREELTATRNTNVQLQEVVADMKSVAKTNEALLMQATSQNVSRVQFQQMMEKMTSRVQQLESALGIGPGGGGGGGSENSGNFASGGIKHTISGSQQTSLNVSSGGGGAPTQSSLVIKSPSTVSGGTGGEPVANRLSQVCREEIARWYESSGVGEQVRGTAAAAQSTREYLDSLQSKFDMLGPMMTTVAQVSKTIEDRVSLVYFNSSFQQLQQDIQRARDETTSLKRTVAAHSNEMNEIGVRLQDVLFRASEFTNKRIGLVYDTLCIEENVNELDVEMPEPIAIANMSASTMGANSSNNNLMDKSLNGSGRTGTPGGASVRGAAPNSTSSTPAQDEQQPVTVVVSQQDGAASRTSTPKPPQASLTTTRIGKMNESVRGEKDMAGSSFLASAGASTRKKQSVARPLDAEEAAAKGASLLQTPMFIAFRQAILSDISDRVHSTYSSQSSDFGSEVLALRADIRQRVTAQRVIELIKQHQDTETPIRVDQLAKRLDHVEQSLVTQEFFAEALRTKTDVKVSDLKADRSEVEAVSSTLQADLAVLRETVTALNAEREDLRAVAHELDAQVKRDAALRRLFPDGIRQAGGSTSAAAGRSAAITGMLEDADQQHQQRGVVQPFLPAIVKLVPIEESAVAKYLPLQSDVAAAPPPPDPRTASRTQSKASRLSSRATTTTTNAAVGGPTTPHQPHAPHVATGNQTPVSRHNNASTTTAAATTGVGTTSKVAPRTDNQEAYARLVQEKAELSERAKAKSHPPIPYELSKPSTM